MEVDVDEDPMEVWQSHDVYPTIPHAYIECPLSKDQLGEAYSLPLVSPQDMAPSSLYAKQENAMCAFYQDPPLTKPTPSNPKGRAKHYMRPLAAQTLDTRVRTVREYVGFAYKWLGVQATMELVLHPQVVAKYFGFHVAKGTQEGTLKRIATQLSQATTFVMSSHCPKPKAPPMGPTHLKATSQWYTNLNGKLLASINASHTTRGKLVTLWNVWEATLTKYAKFVAKLKVRGGMWGCPLPCTHPHPPIPWCVGAQGQMDPSPTQRMPRECDGYYGGGRLPATLESGGHQAHALPLSQGW